MSNNITEGTRWECGRCEAENIAHGFHWCHQVCASCQTPHWEKGEQRRLLPDGFFSGESLLRVRAQIARDGRYIPQFS